MGLSRFELLTPRLSSVCSNQLSYRPLFFQQARRPALLAQLHTVKEPFGASLRSGSLKTR